MISSFKKLESKSIKKDYFTSKIITNQLLNFDFIREELHKNENINTFLSFSKSRVDEFKKIWGDPNFRYRREYLYSVWYVENNGGCKALIFTAKGFGTQIEIVTDNVNEEQIKLFYNDYVSMINELETK